MSSTTEADGRLPPGRTALITGASRGIGLACARALHEAGARVALLARSTGPLDTAARELGADARAVVLTCDLADPEALRRAVDEVRAALGGAPDILVNNAGQFTLAPIERTSLDELERALRVNLVGPFALVRSFVGEMRARRRGHIVTIGSIADRVALPGNAAYSASKFGARALHEVLREELRGSGVRTTLISPGSVDTALWDPIRPETRQDVTPRAQMLPADSVADAVRWAVTRPEAVNVEELRIAPS